MGGRMSALKRIEEKHLPYGDHPGCLEYQQYDGPCDLVKLARALTHGSKLLRDLYRGSCECGTDKPGACVLCEMERTLSWVSS